MITPDVPLLPQQIILAEDPRSNQMYLCSNHRKINVKLICFESKKLNQQRQTQLQESTLFLVKYLDNLSICQGF